MDVVTQNALGIIIFVSLLDIARESGITGIGIRIGSANERELQGATASGSKLGLMKKDCPPPEMNVGCWSAPAAWKV